MNPRNDETKNNNNTINFIINTIIIQFPLP